jgi:hypothetical protein
MDDMRTDSGRDSQSQPVDLPSPYTHASPPRDPGRPA